MQAPSASLEQHLQQENSLFGNSSLEDSSQLGNPKLSSQFGELGGFKGGPQSFGLGGGLVSAEELN